MSSAPSSPMRAHFSTAPWRSRRKCHGTMLAWCSISVSTISSPGLTSGARKLSATRLKASVPPWVRTISSRRPAFT